MHRTADLVTAYRNVAMLLELELIDAVGFQEGQTRYEARHSRQPHYHIQCQGGRRIADLVCCGLKKLTEVVERRARCAAESLALESFGEGPEGR